MAEDAEKSNPNGHPAAQRPEAFGRGEHPEKKKDDEKDQKNDKKGDKGGEQDKDEKKDQPPKKPFWKRPVLLSVMIGVALVLAVSGLITWVHLEHFESTDDAFIDGRITRISPRVTGKVLRLNVEDNQVVAADTVLVEIDPEPFQVRVLQAEASVAQAVAQQRQNEANEVVASATADQADADVVVAQANQANAARDFKRFSNLPAEARSQQQVDQVTATQESTKAQVTSAQKKADAMHAQADAAKKTTDASRAMVLSSQRQLAESALDLQYTKVVAGRAGRITQRRVEQGQYLTAGQEILDVVPTDPPDNIWVTANFKETQLTKMEKGQRVTISVDAFPGEKLNGHIDSIQNGTGAVFSLLPAENATGNYVKVVQRIPVKIIIDDKPRHLLSPGMSVEPEVDVRDHQQTGDGPDSNASNSQNRP